MDQSVWKEHSGVDAHCHDKSDRKDKCEAKGHKQEGHQFIEHVWFAASFQSGWALVDQIL